MDCDERIRSCLMKIIFGVVSADEFDNVGKIRKHNFFFIKKIRASESRAAWGKLMKMKALKLDGPPIEAWEYMQDTISDL